MDARSAYRQSQVRGATQVGLVVLLYEQMIDDLRHATEHLQQKQIELRTGRINHAILVLGHLQSTLDIERGGKVARHLERYYNLLRSKLMEAQARASQPLLTEQIAILLKLRDAWLAVDRSESGPQSAEQPDAAADAAPVLEWQG